MRRLAAATLSLSWTAIFAALSGFALLAAEEGTGAAMIAFGLPVVTAVDGIASRPALAGFCLGAAVVAALFATVLVSSVLNAKKDLRQGALIADMGFGGALGLSILAFLAFFTHPAYGLAAAALVLAAMLVGSLCAMRAAMAAPATEPSLSSQAVRSMARDAAANINVVRFPIERAAGVR